MSFTVDNFSGVIKSFAPNNLKWGKDNIGLMVGEEENEITNILVALDCTEVVIDEAIEKNCSLIFTHHPLLYLKPKNITDKTLQGRKIRKLIKNDIDVFSAHTNLDACDMGLAEKACLVATGKKGEFVDPHETTPGYGYGRIADLDEEISFKEYISLVKERFGMDNMRVCGDLDKKISRVAVLNGSGEDALFYAIGKGAQCIITGDITYHFMSDLNENGICIMEAGHYEIEKVAFEESCNEILKKLRESGFKGEMIKSENIVNPYTYI